MRKSILSWLNRSTTQCISVFFPGMNISGILPYFKFQYSQFQWKVYAPPPPFNFRLYETFLGSQKFARLYVSIGQSKGIVFLAFWLLFLDKHTCLVEKPALGWKQSYFISKEHHFMYLVCRTKFEPSSIFKTN